MKQFVGLYFLFLAVLFAFFYIPNNTVSIFINNTQTELTLFLLKFFLKPNQLQGIDIWINPHYKIIINHACNGVIPILFLSASILAYPAGFLYKTIWIFAGYVIFTIINVIRILIVVYATQYGDGQGEFYWSHDIMGNILLITTGLVLFVLFVRSSSNSI